jgi:lipid-A-disaccharide synthase
LVPEFIQEDVTAAALSDAVLSLMRSTDQTDQLITHFRDISQVLRQSASQKAAEAVAELLEDRAAGKEV